MVQWTPLVTGMFLFRVVLFFVGMVWLRHMIVSLVIFLRNISVERENDGLYRLITYSDGIQTSVLLHGETQGELLKAAGDEAGGADDMNVMKDEQTDRGGSLQLSEQEAPLNSIAPEQEGIRCLIASSPHPAPC